MYISDLIGKPLISLAESRWEGVIKNAVFDNRLKRILWLTIFNEQSETESAISTPLLHSTDGDALTTKFSDDVLPLEQLAERENNPILAEVYNTSGRLIGKLTDIELDNKLNVTALYIDNARTEVEPIGFSTTAVVLEGEKKVKLTRAAIKKSHQKNRSARILPILEPPQPNTIGAGRKTESNAPQGIAAPIAPPIAATATPTPNQTVLTQSEMVFNGKAPQEYMPQRIIGNYEFLLGRTVAESIKNQSGDIIVEKDTVITETTVETARRYGRLIELTLQSVV